MDSNRNRNDLNHQRHSCGCSGTGQNNPAHRHSTVRPVSEDCGCGMNTGSQFDQSVIAMAYVPWQKFEETWMPEEGLYRGTIFPSLYKPFMRGGCSNHERTK